MAPRVCPYRYACEDNIQVIEGVSLGAGDRARGGFKLVFYMIYVPPIYLRAILDGLGVSVLGEESCQVMGFLGSVDDRTIVGGTEAGARGHTIYKRCWPGAFMCSNTEPTG